MRLRVALEQVRAAVCMAVALEHDVDVVLIKDRRQLRALEHVVAVARAVQVLMHRDNAPLRVRVRGQGFLDGLLVFGAVKVIQVKHHEHGFPVSVIVVAAGFRLAVFRRVRGVEVVREIRVERVVVADGRGKRHRLQRGRVQ